MIQIICAMIAAVAGILSAVVTTRNTRHNKDMEKLSELRSVESRLMLDMIHANMKLSVGTAMAIKNGRANGELSDGLEAVRECDEKYSEFLQEIAITQLTK